MTANIVYSTGLGRICAGCRRPEAGCVCRAANGQAQRGEKPIRVSRATQGRGGRIVTVINGLPLNDGQLLLLTGELKRRCGSGGTVRDGSIEIQGEHRDTLVAELVRRGFAARRSGG